MNDRFHAVHCRILSPTESPALAAGLTASTLATRGGRVPASMVAPNQLSSRNSGKTGTWLVDSLDWDGRLATLTLAKHGNIYSDDFTQQVDQ